MTVKLLTEHHLELLSLIGGCTGSSESMHVKMPRYRKSHVMAQILQRNDRKMTILWSSSNLSFVKFHGVKFREPQHDHVISISV